MTASLHPRRSTSFSLLRLPGPSAIQEIWPCERWGWLLLLEDIVSNALANVISAAALNLAAAARAALRGKRVTEGQVSARWLESYQLTRAGLDIPASAAKDEAVLGRVLNAYETQAVLHELLAARLTGATEADIARIQSVWHQTLFSYGPAAELDSAWLFAYCDSEISTLVDRMKREAPELLREIRGDAFNVRMLSILNAIERHAASISANSGPAVDEGFLSSYRLHVIDYHGKLEPPDFDRRRPVPIADLYVAPTVIQVTDADPRDPPVEIDLWTLAGQLDRAVLLGDPGGGKTTAANVLMAHHAAAVSRRLPFLVTLREFAAQDPPDRSVVRYIDHRLEVVHQCQPPEGLVNRLLLTGHALVIFDGLDELLDASHRVGVAQVIEQFCSEYPLAEVLVTSRIVGYDQARLDDRQFSVYRLGSLTDDQISEYAHKWFRQEAIPVGEAERWASAFLAESAIVADLRATPLMLSLMCILYKGEGSLPRNRAQVYQQCATLLHRQWDARRRIHPPLRAGRLVEPTLRHLGWWMINLGDARAVVPERNLVAEITRFLYGRGFETEEDAQDEAWEFIRIFKGRMWVLSDVGVAESESLYAFTHRTFLEYFAAEHLAYSHDSPENLAEALMPRIADNEWDMLGEVAIQIKDRTIDQGGRRLYDVLLGNCESISIAGRSAVLQFMGRCLRSIDPTPAMARKLTSTVLDHLFSGNPNDKVYYLPLCWLMANSELYKDVVSDEISTRINAMVESSSSATRRNGLRLAIWAPYGITWFGDNGPHLDRQSPLARYWRDRRDDNVRSHAELIVAAATDDLGMRNTALWADLITVDQASLMPGGLGPLLQHWPTGIFGGQWGGELLSAARNIATGYHARGSPSYTVQATQLTMLGRYFAEHPTPPWITGAVHVWPGFFAGSSFSDGQSEQPLDPMLYLGTAASLLIAAEAATDKVPPREGAQWFGPLNGLYAYIQRRWRCLPDESLPKLPVSDDLAVVFHNWAIGRVHFIAR